MSPASVAGSVSGLGTLDALRNKMPSNNKTGRVEAKYDVVLDYPNLELHSAAASGNVGLVHYALTHGQPVNSLLHGCLPLHAACSGGSVSVVRMLIERGADVNAPRLPRRYSEGKKGSAPAVGATGSTPLHFAAANGHNAVVQILLAGGAVPDKPDKNGHTPEDLALASGYTDVVRTLRVWLQLHESSSPTNPASVRPITLLSDSSAAESSTAPPNRSRANSVSSQSAAPMLQQLNGSTNNKGKERAGSLVSMASDRGLRFLRNGISSRTDSGAGEAANGTDTQQTPLAGPSGNHQVAPADLTVTTTTTTTTTDFDHSNPSSGLPSPFQPSLPTSPIDEDPEMASPSRFAVTESSDSSPTSVPQQRSSRRPSLPSIIERATHPGQTLRSAMRKMEQDSSPSISESSPPHHSKPMFGRRGRENSSGRTKAGKQAIMQMFRRASSPRSRSPSPPPPQMDASRAIDPEKLEQGLERIRASTMDPELQQMALDMVRLSEKLEVSTAAAAAATVTSAPVTKTQFFDDVPTSPGSKSVTGRTAVSSLGSPPSIDRISDRRPRAGSGVISPSPLANEWAMGDSSEEEPSRRVGIRRSLTEVKRTSQYHPPRRVPSAPVIPGLTKPRSSTMPSTRQRLASLSRPMPPSMASSGNNSPLSSATDAADGDDEVDDMSPLPTFSQVSPVEEAAHESFGATSQLSELTITGQDSGTVPKDPVQGGDIVGADGEAQSAVHVEAPTPQLDPSETLSDRAGSNSDAPDQQSTTDTRRFRGASVGSNGTDSSRGALTPPPPSLRHLPSNPVVPVEDVDFRSLGFVAAPSRASRKHTGGRSRAQSTSSVASSTSGHAGASVLSSAGVVSSNFAPVPEHGVSNDQSRPVRRVYSHQQARDAMEQSERDVLELAQQPDSETTSRDLAAQLAAYGDSHAQAEELARVERMSQGGGGSSESRSHTSGESSKHKNRRSSGRMSRAGAASPALPTLDTIRAPSSSINAINSIYDRRTSAYKDRLSTLSAAPPIYQAYSRARSPASTARSRAASGSDAWLNAGPTATPHSRRHTDPTHISRPTLSGSDVDVDRHPHISSPMPIVSDLNMSRGNQRKSVKAALPSRQQISSSIKTLTPLTSANTATTATAPRDVPAFDFDTPTSSHMVRGGSVHRAGKDPSTRYHGLAQARSFAQAQRAGLLDHSAFGSFGLSGMGTGTSSPRNSESDSDYQPAPHSFPIIQHALLNGSASPREEFSEGAAAGGGVRRAFSGRLKGARKHIKGAVGSLGSMGR